MSISLQNQTNIYYKDTFTKKTNSSLLIKKLYQDIKQHSNNIIQHSKHIVILKVALINDIQFQLALLIKMKMEKTIFFSFFLFPFSSFFSSSPPRLPASPPPRTSRYRHSRLLQLHKQVPFFQRFYVHSKYSRSCFVILSCYSIIVFNLCLSVVLYTNAVCICFHILSLEIYSRLEQ